VLARLAEEYRASGKPELFEQLRPHLTQARGETAYTETAAATGLSESGVKSAIFRLRRRYGEIFREEVEGTVAGPEEVEEEIRYLLSVLAQN
jgi:hypothetical protein